MAFGRRRFSALAAAAAAAAADRYSRYGATGYGTVRYGVQAGIANRTDRTRDSRVKQSEAE